MKSLLRPVVLLFLTALPAIAQEAGGARLADTAGARVADLGWLAGHWQGTLRNGAVFETHYTDATAGTILSVSKEHRNGRTLGFELELFYEKDGRVIYQPHPNGKRSEHAFPLLAYDAAARRVTFENKEHDFPQTFTFHLAGPDNLVIRLGGPGRDGATREIVYDLKRVKP
jgi:hypothetical protein